MTACKTTTHDKQGNPWAKLSDLQDGSKVRVDGGFGCLRENTIHEVHANDHGLYIECDQGQHYLDGQTDDGEHLVGMYSA